MHEDVEMADPSDELENARPTIDRPTTDGELQELKLKYQTVVVILIYISVTSLVQKGLA